MTNDTLRRDALFTYLTTKGDNWTSQREIVADLALWYEPKEGEEGKAFHQSHARRVLTKDIRSINLIPDFHQIIISGNKGVKLATQDEMVQHLNRVYAANMRRLYYSKILRQKAGLDGQYTVEEHNHIQAFINKHFGGEK